MSSSSSSLMSFYLAPPYLEIGVLPQTQPFNSAPFGSPLSSSHQVRFHQIYIHQLYLPQLLLPSPHIPLLTQCLLQLHIRNTTSVEGGEEEEDELDLLKKQSEDAQWKRRRIPLRFNSSEKGTSDCWADSVISMVEAGYVVPHSKKRTQKNGLDIGRRRRTPCKGQGRVEKRHAKLTFIILQALLIAGIALQK